MLTRYLPLLLVFLIYLVRMIKINSNNRSLTLVLLIVTSTSPVISLSQVDNQMCGEFGSVIWLYPSFFFSCYYLLKTNKKNFFSISPMLIVFIIYLSYNIFNKDNEFRQGAYPAIAAFFQLILFIVVVKKTFKLQVIYDCLYECFLCWTILQGILTLCYPVLGLSYVANLFSDVANEWSLKRSGYVSAVGTFPHPSQLAYVCSAYACFFYISYLNSYRRITSKSLFFINVLIVIFTYSRTSYVGLFVALWLIYVLNRKEFNMANFLKYLGLFVVLIFTVSLIPSVNDLFLKSDSNEMIDARMLHWAIGEEIWEKFKWFGCGLNTHVRYMSDHANIFQSLSTYNLFITSNPIHNIHIIILAEGGLIGVFFWLYWQFQCCVAGYRRIGNKYFDNMLGILMIVLTAFTFVYGFFGWSFFNAAVYTPFLLLLLICL